YGRKANDSSPITAAGFTGRTRKCSVLSRTAVPRSWVDIVICAPVVAIVPSFSTPVAIGIAQSVRWQPVSVGSRLARKNCSRSRLYLAPPTLSTPAAEQEAPLRSVVPGQCRDSSGGCPRPQASRSRDRFPLCAPYLGSELTTSPAHPLRHPSRRSLPRSPPLDSSSLPLLLATPRPPPCLPR